MRFLSEVKGYLFWTFIPLFLILASNGLYVAFKSSLYAPFFGTAIVLSIAIFFIMLIKIPIQNYLIRPLSLEKYYDRCDVLILFSIIIYKIATHLNISFPYHLINVYLFRRNKEMATPFVFFGNMYQINSDFEDAKRMYQMAMIIINKLSNPNKQIYDPWKHVLEQFHEGDSIQGKVIDRTNYATFVEIAPGITSIMPIIYPPEKIIKVGQEVQAVIMEIDLKNCWISLGIKEAKDDLWNNITEIYA